MVCSRIHVSVEYFDDNFLGRAYFHVLEGNIDSREVVRAKGQNITRTKRMSSLLRLEELASHGAAFVGYDDGFLAEVQAGAFAVLKEDPYSKEAETYIDFFKWVNLV